MTENLAGRGEGLAGLIERVISAGDDLRYDEYGVMEMPTGHLATKWDIAKRELETALEAAAPPGTPSEDTSWRWLRLRGYLRQWLTPHHFGIAMDCLDKAEVPAATQEPAGSGVKLKPAVDTVTNLPIGGSPRKVGEDGQSATETMIRMFLWGGHGHEGIYGDDGEMQCGDPRLWGSKSERRVVSRSGVRSQAQRKY